MRAFRLLTAWARTTFLVAALGLAGIGAARAADSGQTAQHKVTQSVSYVPVEPMYASILSGTKPRGLLLVEIGLDVPDPNFRDRVTRALPLLRDAYVRALLVYAATAVRPWRQPSVPDIANRMQAITNHVMGKSGAQVLMAQTVIRITR